MRQLLGKMECIQNKIQLVKKRNARIKLVQK